MDIIRMGNFKCVFLWNGDGSSAESSYLYTFTIGFPLTA